MTNIGPATVTISPPVHNVPAVDSSKGPPPSPAWIKAVGQFLIESFLAQVALALGNISVLGVHPFFFLTAWGQALEQQASNAYTQSVTAQTTATTAQNTSNNIITALVGGLTGSSTSAGTDPTAIALSFINQGVQLPVQFLDQILGSLASLQGQLTAIQNNPTGASQTDDFAAVDLTAWTSLL